MRIVNTGVYHRNQNAFSGQTIAAVFLNGTQTGSLPGGNNLKEKLPWTFYVDYLWKSGKPWNVIFGDPYNCVISKEKGKGRGRKFIL